MREFIPPATRFFALPSPLAMKRGGELLGARLAYETWGQLDDTRGNAVLLLTGLSPSAHAAAHADDPSPGWWEAMLGPGRPLDTERWFVICVNSLGSCKGSTGPASLHPGDGQPWRLRFPDLSIEDGAEAVYALLQGLGIRQLAAVVGNSMGGMTALALAHAHPGITRTLVDICGAARALPFSIAVRSLQREAIRLDPLWQDGNYDNAHYPEHGMRIARKLGVITYRSALEWDGRFSRVRLDSERRDDDPFGQEFEIESYLEGHARRFVRQFDPNSYLYLSRSMDWFDLGEHCLLRCGDGDADTRRALAAIRVQKALVIGVETDILFPLQQQQEIADGLREGGVDVTFMPMPSPQGHDAFLVDIARFGPALARFFDAL